MRSAVSLWSSLRRAKIRRIEAEAETLLRDLGDAAYAEACRREHEASSDTIAEDWRLVASAVARLSGRREESESSSHLEANVILIPDREPARSSKAPSLSALRHADEPSAAGPTTESFRIQYLGAASHGQPALLKEVEVQASNSSAAIIVAAATLDLPPMGGRLRRPISGRSWDGASKVALPGGSVLYAHQIIVRL
jgi:hypothetical protein